MTKLNIKSIQEILDLCSNPKTKRKDVCDLFNISKSTLAAIVSGKSWKKVSRTGFNLRKNIQINNLPILTEHQTEIINGSLLGDGSIKFTHGHCCFRKSQSIVNLEYLQDLSSNLEPYSNKSLYQFLRPNIIHNNCGKIIGYDISKHFKYCEYYSICHKVFDLFGDKWYKKNQQNEFIFENKHRIKIVPKNLNLTPLTLAIWFCDDGTNWDKHGRATFCTNGFNKECVDFLSKQLFDKFNLENNVFFQTTGYVIRIRRKSYIDFIDIIKPFITWECLQYKVKTSLYVAPKFFKKPYHHKKAEI